MIYLITISILLLNLRKCAPCTCAPFKLLRNGICAIATKVLGSCMAGWKYSRICNKMKAATNCRLLRLCSCALAALQPCPRSSRLPLPITCLPLPTACAACCYERQWWPSSWQGGWVGAPRACRSYTHTCALLCLCTVTMQLQQPTHTAAARCTHLS